MKIFIIRATILFMTSIFSHFLFAQQLSFPTADGFGRYAIGGRGGSVYHVTSLADSGPGTFREGVSKPNRIIVFDVGGIIKISSRIVMSSNLTIAGQTAPGDGITEYGDGVSYSNANHTITRFIRFRMSQDGTSGKDAIAIADGHDIIMDHVSVSWGRDGTLDVNGAVTNFTFQDGIISQGLDPHSTGGLMQSDFGTSILRTLYIDNHTRNPKVKGKNQFINNVIYNWEVGAYILGDSESDSWANVTGNYFINGPSEAAAPFTRGNMYFQIFAEKNYYDNNRNGKLDGNLILKAEYGNVDWLTKPYDYPVVKEMSAAAAFNYILMHAGASLKRDEVDKRMIVELASLGTLGEIVRHDFDAPMNGVGIVHGGAALPDSDQDGMPDSWEKAYGSDPGKADSNGDLEKDGYTNIENYINCLVGEGNCHGLITSTEEQSSNDVSNISISHKLFYEDFTIFANGVFSYSIFNLKGELLERNTGLNSCTAGNGLPGGIHFIKIEAEHGSKTFKITKY